MIQGIKKANPKRPQVVSDTSEEKLVRHKCVGCKKQFLAYRRSDHHDLKTCDNCLRLKEIPVELVPESSTNIEKPEPVQPILQPILTPVEDVAAVLPVCEVKDLSPIEIVESVKQETVDEVVEKPEEESTVPLPIPCRIGSYSVRQKILHENHFLSIGDIVSLRNEGTDYYAQITVFVESVFCEKYAALIWLLPTTSRSSVDVGFDPFSFVYGPEDESFYDVRQLKFIMHPPTQFYKRFIPPVPKNSDILGIKHKYKVNCKRKV